MQIQIKKITSDELNTLHIFSWPIWEKEPSEFEWYYDAEEHCYFLQGEVEVYNQDKSKKLATISPKDYVIFPKGLKCIWKIKSLVKKHYKFK